MARFPKRLTVMKTSLKKPTPERAVHPCASPGASERIQDWVLGGVAADTDSRSFGARGSHVSRSHQYIAWAEPFGGIGGQRTSEGHVLDTTGVQTALVRARPAVTPLVDTINTHGRERPHRQEITRRDKKRQKKYSTSVAERSFPLLDLLEMNCQPRAQLLLHRWG